jgi:hypothetical protein
MRGSECWREVLLVASLCSSCATATAAAAGTESRVRGLPTSAAAVIESAARVRSTDSRILELLTEGVERSATFRSLVDAIDRSDGIVYVEFGYCAFGHLNGCLLPFVASSHGDRYLRILVTPDKNRRSHDQLIALTAHELRHAVEVIQDKEVVDADTMEAMYRRIGTPLTGSRGGYETSAARASGEAVLSELLTKCAGR